MTSETKMRNIGRNIHMLLYDKKMTKTELGKKVGLSHAMISYIVAGERRTNIDTLAKIAEVLDTTVDDLMKGGEKV